MKLLVTHEVDVHGGFCEGCIKIMRTIPDEGKSELHCTLFYETLTPDLHGRLFRCEACLEAEARANKVMASAARLSEVLS